MINSLLPLGIYVTGISYDVAAAAVKHVIIQNARLKQATADPALRTPVLGS
jgi:hypothetical protein